jgi:O-antigen ligase
MWSIAPDISLRRCIALLCTALFAIYICARYELRSMLRLLAIACGAVILLSLAFIVLLPSIGVSPIDQSWRGVFPNKNTFGRNLLLSAIVFSYVETGPGWRQMLRRTGIAAAMLLLWLCGSRGPLLVFLSVVPVMLLLGTLRFRLETRALLGVSLLLLTFVGAAGTLLYSEEVFELLARDPTLTGRTELWSLVGAAVTERPWVGYGYGAFWEAT